MLETLDHLAPAQSGIIDAIEASPDLARRMSALGLRPGRTVEVIRAAPWHGPLQIRVGHTDIMIRRRDAACIAVRTGH